ncbi:DUF2383 domain-containing protein [Clostridium ganghwense]|uniref:DUF2383 domain-containing protein n=1 Tax=Clostridium ganghwense TaxID=312089 RepID=A0ABT4CKD1_9CLOT|nr:DUF2383 domain-containing protein [Clostridium ganghwense]MCY6369504.1 DUF2383 domain-containing protein [Clostridium ganghwense]
MNNKTNINELNKILKGEHMAVDSFDKFIKNVNEPNIKSELQKIQQNHRQHTTQIAERIQQLGGNPANNVGIQGMITEAVSNIRDMGNQDTLHYLNKAYDGENIGVNSAAEIVKSNLDTESMTLINNILNEDRNNVNTLNNLINNLQ